MIVGGTSLAQGDVVKTKPAPILLQYDEITGDIDWHSQINVSGSI